MAGPVRVTRPFLEVLDVLLGAWQNGEDVHGWTIMKAVNRPGPTVYKVLDRLEDNGWITGWWEERNPHPGRPPRRLYRLTPTGRVEAAALIEQRRPAIIAHPGTNPGRMRSPRWGGAR